MTEKLYYKDSHIFSFSATVTQVTEHKGRTALVLDRTAFFPEGGGQRADTGYIGASRVLDVHEYDGRILHFVDKVCEQGSVQDCTVDAEQRLRRMQNHSGEHIVSGIVHNKYGYENVGFHMAEDCMTIDFDGELTWQQLEEAETLANEAVRANIPIRTFFPSPQELPKMEYRSKLELTHDVRIVEIEGIDRCACCAPHVSRTGEIGVIKLLTADRHRGGVRITLVCGMDALRDFREKSENVRRISELLSVKKKDTADGVDRILSEQARLKEKNAELAMKCARLMAASYTATDGNICVFENTLGDNAIRELVNLLAEKCAVAAVFSGDDVSGYKYIIGSVRTDLRTQTKKINSAICGRGGGRSTMIQGSCTGSRELIQKFLESGDI